MRLMTVSRSIIVLFAAVSLATVGLHAQTLRDKIGQMLMLGFPGSTLDDTIKTDLSSRNLGGVILMGGNCLSPQQIKQLTASIDANALTPPLISTDEEGGLVARLNQNNGYTRTYTAYQTGSVFRSTDSTYAQAARMAGWMADAGFSVDLAPVADVNVNPNSPAIGAYGRSFSSNPVTVGSHVQRFVDAFHARHLATCFKHFPGHGSAGTDSHLTLPDITNTWADSELVPYSMLLASNSVDMIMVGHLFNARIDSIYPSSLSRNTVTGLLRDSLGYQGVVISDDFYNMKAITDNFGFGETAVHAINAGVDILLYVNDLHNGASLCRQLVDTIEACVQSGTISAARIDEAYQRIRALKQSYVVTSVAEEVPQDTLPRYATLQGSYPNPFNSSTVIQFKINAVNDWGLTAGQIRLAVYDVLGREVKVLVDGVKTAGTYTVQFDGRNLATGVYYCRMTAGRTVETRSLVLLK